MPSKERGVPGEGANPRRTNLDTDAENGGVDSNHAADFTVNGPTRKQKNCGPGCRPDPVWPDLKQAERFLRALDPAAIAFTFQTFDDNRDRHDNQLLRVLHGTLEQHASTLQRLNAQGAGIFVTINETDFKGRKATNIVRVRALFLDLDGAPLPENGPTANIITETSPRRWHAYWRVKGVALEEFSDYQKALIERHGGDNVHDLPRVMRLPGFFHRKGRPYLVRIISALPGVYEAHEFEKKPKEKPRARQK